MVSISFSESRFFLLCLFGGCHGAILKLICCQLQRGYESNQSIFTIIVVILMIDLQMTTNTEFK